MSDKEKESPIVQLDLSSDADAEESMSTPIVSVGNTISDDSDIGPQIEIIPLEPSPEEDIPVVEPAPQSELEPVPVMETAEQEAEPAPPKVETEPTPEPTLEPTPEPEVKVEIVEPVIEPTPEPEPVQEEQKKEAPKKKVTFQEQVVVDSVPEETESKSCPSELKGKIIVLEGADACGKTTQIHALIKLYRQKGYTVDLFDFPRYSQTFYGKLIRQYLDGEFGDPNEVDPYLSSMLYAGDRYETKNDILDSRKKGHLILINRYVPSNIVYNVCKIRSVVYKKAFVNYVEKLEYDTNCMPTPDIVVYLDVPSSTSQELLNNRESKDEYEKNVQFQEKVCQEYRKLCKERSEEGWAMVPCTDANGLLDVEKITSRIESTIERVNKKIDLIRKPKSTIKNAKNKRKGAAALALPAQSGRSVDPIQQSQSQKNNVSLADVVIVSNKNVLPQEDREIEDLKDISQPEPEAQQAELSRPKKDDSIPKLSKNTQLILKRRIQQRTMNQSGMGKRAQKQYQQQLEMQKQRDQIRRQQNLLKHVHKKRTNAGVPEPPKSVMNKINPPKPTKSLLLSREIVERTRKTNGICSAIFGSDSHVKNVYLLFLQKYSFKDLPPKFKHYFRALIQHYYSGEITMYPEDIEFKKHLDKCLVFDNEKWFEHLDKLYHEYRLALKRENGSRRWFPEEIIMISSIWKQKLVFGEHKFDVIQLDIKRLQSIYITNSPVSKQFKDVAKYLHDHTPKVGVIQIDL
jgi:dTMP kinase